MPARPRFALALLATVVTGCAPTKTVTINTLPEGAHLVFTKIGPAGEAPFTPDRPVSETPATVGLDFSNGSHYGVVAHRELCIPSPVTDLAMDEQTTYTVRLNQYKLDVQAITYTPTRDGEVWKLQPTLARTVASLDPAEPDPVYVTPPVNVTSNKLSTVDFPGFAVSPSADVMVYGELTRNAATASGFAGRLFKLPLSTGESATLLTQGEKHQRFPTFDVTGDKVICDSDDNLRTDAPLAFELAGNEATVDVLEHDSNTLEYGFSAGKNYLAFTSYGENATGPTIQVCSPDGTGPTPRGQGVSPQISPDGNRLLYSGRPEAGGKSRLWTVNVRGPKSLRKLGPIDDADCLDPRWSPDGKYVAFCSPKRGLDGKELPADVNNERDPRYWDPEDAHSFIWVMRADGQRPIRITRNESFDSHPVWDRNGKTLYFRSNRGGVWNIWKVDLTNAAFDALGGQGQ